LLGPLVAWQGHVLLCGARPARSTCCLAETGWLHTRLGTRPERCPQASQLIVLSTDRYSFCSQSERTLLTLRRSVRLGCSATGERSISRDTLESWDALHYPQRMTTSTTLLSMYQLRIVLRGISPLIWRRMLVRSDLTLSRLQAILQMCLPGVMSICTVSTSTRALGGLFR
jgi:hypothetical protein